MNPNSQIYSLKEEDRKKPVYTISQVEAYTRYLMGRVLTIVDASIVDKKQKKAIKDILNNAVWSGGFGAISEYGACQVTKSEPEVYFPFYEGREPIVEPEVE